MALLVGWSGMRGAVSLAAALALPATIAGERLFPARSQLIEVTFGVILFTLVGQGLSLTPLIRVLGVQPDDEAEHELRQARRALTEAALFRLEDLAVTDAVPEALIADQRAHFEKQLRRLSRSADGAGGDQRDGDDRAEGADGWSTIRHLRREVLSAQRSMLIMLRNQGKVNDEVVRRLERDLDLEKQHEQQHVGG
jgi:CPA1 family monovalent cation:H+ antiporter